MLLRNDKKADAGFSVVCFLNLRGDVMLLFEGILVMLLAILISNVINRFIPVLSIPIIQIALGTVIALLPFGFTITFDPELFLVLFIAPLLFNEAAASDSNYLWKLKIPIMLLAFGLVFLTVLTVGYFTHFLIPSIPLAAAFALAAALAPTDAVAVSALGKRMKIPHTLMHILRGESLINDASSIVSFQFALAAMLTGTFSIVGAEGEFLFIALGGTVIGLLLTGVKYVFVKWLRSMGMENVTLHILLGILTPFLIFIVAEHFDMSGILAVVAAGIVHSFERKKINPETANLNVASASIWSTLDFALNGLVFLLLGTQIPLIMEVVWYDENISNVQTISYIIIITLALIFIRFFWSLLTIDKKFYEEEEPPVSRLKMCLIVSMSGVRGTIALASAMSIPFFLLDGSLFPKRHLIIFIVSGVILCSLLLANFVLPLFLERKTKKTVKDEEMNACIEIIHHVIAELNTQLNEENKRAVMKVIRDYYQRLEELRRKRNSNPFDEKEEEMLKNMIYHWEKENTEQMMKRNEIDESTAESYFHILQKLNKERFRSIKHYFRTSIRFVNAVKHMKGHHVNTPQMDLRKQFFILRKANCAYVLEQLKALYEKEKNPLLRKYISEYNVFVFMQNNRFGENAGGESDNEEEQTIEHIVALGFQLERDEIQRMFEEGRISWEIARDMRRNMSLLELQMKKGDL